MRGYREEGVVFRAGEARLLGVAAIPEQPSSVAVLFLVGGPQYRAGSHRQFTLLARFLAEQGFASLRFDYPGMGDSEGQPVAFADCQSEVGAAVEQLLRVSPAVQEVVLWGLCDAASTAMIVAHKLAPVRGTILVNPWVHGGEYSPGFRLSHYYGPLLSDRGYWKRLVTGQVNVAPAFVDAAKALVALWPFSKKDRSGQQQGGFVGRMLQGSEEFQNPMLFILSEKDLTAKEFLEVTQSSQRWLAILERESTQMHSVKEADHTFSSAAWRQEVADVALKWLQALQRSA